jgi:hypothetical protein
MAIGLHLVNYIGLWLVKVAYVSITYSMYLLHVVLTRCYTGFQVCVQLLYV